MSLVEWSTPTFALACPNELSSPPTSPVRRHGLTTSPWWGSLGSARWQSACATYPNSLQKHAHPNDTPPSHMASSVMRHERESELTICKGNFWDSYNWYSYRHENYYFHTPSICSPSS
ncbi:unnamed protein product [Ectocarpus sp. 12 AP-2014]